MDRYLSACCALLTGGMLWAWHRSSLQVPAVSYLLSHHMDPQGWPIATASLSLASLCLLFSIRTVRMRFARLSLWIGASALLTMGLAAFKVESLGNLHDVLSVLALASLLIGIITGLTAHRRTFWPVIAFLVLEVLLLAAAYNAPDFFDGTHFWRNLALAEWSLIAVLGASLALLLRLDKSQ